MEIIKITSDAERDSLKTAFASRGQSAGDEARRTEVLDNTQAIVNDVRNRGDAAVAEYTERFDGVSLKPGEFEIGPDELNASKAALSSP
ncbi:MAG: histidinol dehydrogenase [Candidatus Hydrogenedentota bacterium]